MIKRLTIRLVVLAMFVVITIFPISAIDNGNYYVVAPHVSRGATVFIGEQGLNVTNAFVQAGAPTSTKIGWWASAADITNTPFSQSYDFGSTGKTSFTVGDTFVGYTGNWYALNTAGEAIAPIFNVQDPTISVNIWDFSQNADVTSKSVPQGELLGFKISTNMISAISDASLRSPIFNTAVGDGYINVRVKDESGATFTSVLTADGGTLSLNSLNITRTPYYLGEGLSNWSTGAYPIGTYTVWAESLLNNMKANYKNGGVDYTTKTISQTVTVSLVANTVRIEANKDSVTRSKPFSVTITGKPSTTYHLWVQGTSDLVGGYDGQPPMVNTGQAGITYIAACATAADQRAAALATPGSALGYAYQNAYPGLVVFDDVAHSSDTGYGTKTAVNVLTSASGTRTVEFFTTNFVKAQDYTIRAEQNFSGSFIRDQVNVKVEKGAVTIVAAGDQSYYLGEEVLFSGTNTESYKTYLFITGPNLNTNGAQLDDPVASVVNMDPLTFVQADVAGDNTWSYYWGTATVSLNPGTYTVYAVSQPDDLAHIAYAANGNVSIFIDTNNPTTCKIGIYQNGWWYLDSDGSKAWNAGDKSFAWGSATDKPVLGDWNGDGRMKAGVFRNGMWILDYDGTGAWSASDKVGYYGGAGSTPIVGDWNNDSKDEIGIVQNGWWYLDNDGSYAWNAGDKSFAWGGVTDKPVLGDWNGDGKMKAGVFRNGTWVLDYDGTCTWSATDKVGYFGGPGWTPIVGDWDNDTKDEIGIYQNGWWYLDYDGSFGWNLGDTSFAWGSATDKPVLGDWNGDGRMKAGVFRNGMWILDNDGNGIWSASDKVGYYGGLGSTPIVGKWG